MKKMRRMDLGRSHGRFGVRRLAKTNLGDVKSNGVEVDTRKVKTKTTLYLLLQQEW
jgi:hypothetical protein